MIESIVAGILSLIVTAGIMAFVALIILKLTRGGGHGGGH